MRSSVCDRWRYDVVTSAYATIAPRASIIVAVLVGLAGLSPARAGDFVQNRGMGGSGVAVVADESAIEVNPAGLSQVPRYSLGLLYAHADTQWSMGTAVIDSKTSPIAMGIDYRFSRVFEPYQASAGYDKLHTLRLALSEFYANKVHFGLGYQVKFFHPEVTTVARTVVHDFNLGFIFPINDWFRLGLSTSEFVPIQKDKPRDPRATLGLGFSPHKAVVLSLDAIGHWDGGGGRDWDMVFGLELLAREQVGLRFGYGANIYREEFKSISTGLGWFFPRGHMGYSYNTEPGETDRHTVSFTLNIL